MSLTAQPRQDRSIKSSSHAVQKQLTLRPLVSEAREAVAKQIEHFLGSNWRISHRLILSRDSKSLENDTYYAWKREGRERPGLLLFQSENEPVVFWDMDKDQPSAIRFQIPFGFLRKGPFLFSATLLRGERRLIFEDALVADGVKLFGAVPYSQRWRAVHDAYSTFSSQQFLGLALSIVEPVSLAHILSVPPEPGTLWEFQPETPARLRLYWICPGARVGLSAGAQARAAEAVAHLKLPPEVNKNILKRVSTVPTIRVAFAGVDRSLNLPDNYLLTSSEGASIGRASVSKLKQSLILRDAFAAPDAPPRIPVEVAWNIGFNKYEIMRLLPVDTPVMSKSNFYEISDV
jgi:hypothetical protein